MPSEIREHNKLVRDRVIEILTAEGIEYGATSYGRATDMVPLLLDKLDEEVAELRAAGDFDSFMVEMCDVLTVVEALAKAKRWKWEDLIALKDQRDVERGKFDQRIFLHYTIEPETVDAQ